MMKTQVSFQNLFTPNQMLLSWFYLLVSN